MSVDLSPFLLDIEHQLWVDSCTAHAGTSALELLLNKSGKAVELDRHFLYYEVRQRSGNPDFGAHLREIGPALKEVGCAPVGWLDNVLYFFGSLFRQWKRKPSARQYRKAAKYRISRYWQVTDVRAELDKGLPVIAGLRLREAFRDCAWDNYMQSPESFKHVVLVVGYRGGEYLIANSWGRLWGTEGMAWMPADIFDATCYERLVIEV